MRTACAVRAALCTGSERSERPVTASQLFIIINFSYVLYMPIGNITYMYCITAYMRAALCTGSDETPITKMCKDGQGGKFAGEGQVYWGLFE